MPKIVDREEMKRQILLAFEKCIQDKPISNISLRDIAARADMTHPKLLNYFSSKEEIVTAYCEYTKYDTVWLLEEWFDTHSPDEYASPLSYLDAFMCYVAEGDKGESRSRGRIQSIVLARYNQDIRRSIAEEAKCLRAMLERRLKETFGDRVGPNEAEVLSILISGIYAYRYNGSLSGAINKNMISQFLKFQ